MSSAARRSSTALGRSAPRARPWLDRELLADAPTVTLDAGFGRQVRDALARRRQWLVEQELARREQDQIIYRSNLLAVLRLRELARTGAQLSGELGLRCV